jgi:DNA-binding transcriptional regulator YiaG
MIPAAPSPYIAPAPAAIRAMIERTGLSQVAVAKAIGVDPRTIRYWVAEEPRRAVPSYAAVFALECLELARIP